MLPVYRVTYVVEGEGERLVLYVEAADRSGAIEAAQLQLARAWGRRQPLPVARLLDVRRRSR